MYHSCQLLHNVSPSSAAGVSVTPSGTSWANSSWVEIDAGISDDWLLTGIVVGAPSSPGPCHLDIGTGSAGAETVIATIPANYHANANALPSWIGLPVPLQIAAGTRVAVRLRKQGTNTSAWYVVLTAYPYSTLPTTLTSTAQPLLVLPTATTQDRNNTATPDTWSAYTELTSGLGSDIALALVTSNTTGGPNGWHYVAIATGGAGAETDIWQGAWYGSTSLNPVSPCVTACKPLIEISSGTRIACRVKDSMAFSRTYDVGIAYYELPL